MGELRANCYVLTQGQDALIIDPADSADFLLELVSREQLKVLGLLATHGHFDHVCATGELQLSLHVPLYLDKKDVFLLKRIRETAEHFMSVKPIIIGVQGTRFYTTKRQRIGPFSFEALPTPGHTPGSRSFYFKSENALFVGDVLFADGTWGSCDHVYSNKKQLEQSVELVRSFSAAVVYPGHGQILVPE